MSGISTGVGLISGIDTAQLINQLLAVEARPRTLAQIRITQIQTQQAGYLDINSKLQALQSAAAAFRTSDIFGSHTAASSDPAVLTATASTSAAQGTYQFLVDRLVTTQQLFSKGFANSNSSPLNAGSFTFEGSEARLDRDTALSDLNSGAGVKRGKIVVTDSSGATATIDLSKAVTVNDVLEAINSNETVKVTASVEGGRFILTDGAGGGGTLSVQNGQGYTTGDSLGLTNAAVGGVITGDRVYSLHGGVSLATLNDGNGVSIHKTVGTSVYDFSITVGSQTANVNIGNIYDSQFEVVEAKVTTIEGVIDRINDALTAAGITNVTAEISSDGQRLQLTDSTGTQTILIEENSSTKGNTAADLGFVTGVATTGTVSGKKIFAGLNETLASNLNGGSGDLGDGFLSFTLHDGSTFSLTVTTDASIQEILGEIQEAADAQAGVGKFSIALNSLGTGIVATDLTTGGSNLIIAGTGGDSTAAALGIETDPAGTSASSVNSGNLQHRYVSRNTLLSSLRNGAGIGTGTFTITDGSGLVETIDIGTDAVTVGDVIDEINSKFVSGGFSVKARINSTGDGIELYDASGTGALKIKVEDTGGSVAEKLHLEGEAKGTGAENVLNGSFERTVEFEPEDTLEDVASKINKAGVGATASIINDGTGSAPFHLSLVSRSSGAAGRFILDTNGFNLGLETLDEGEDSLVFYGSTDPAKAVMLTSSSNTLDGVVQGVTIDLKGTSKDPVNVTVSRDIDSIASKIETLLKTFNDAIARIDFQTRYDLETNARGPLLGEGTALTLRNSLFSTVLGKALNVGGDFERLADVGVKVGDGGVLTLDRDRFREAMESDPESVKALFAARDSQSNTTQNPIPGNTTITATIPGAKDTFTSLGIAGLIEELTKSYIDSVDGILTIKRKSFDDQIALQQKRIEQFDLQLENKRKVLEQQFLAMEQAIAQLQAQQSSLSQIQSIG